MVAAATQPFLVGPGLPGCKSSFRHIVSVPFGLGPRCLALPPNAQYFCLSSFSGLILRLNLPKTHGPPSAWPPSSCTAPPCVQSPSSNAPKAGALWPTGPRPGWECT